MIIKIIGTGTHNQGAELMAAAISEWIYSHGTNRTLVVDYLFGSEQARRRYGLQRTHDLPGRWGRGKLAYLLLRKSLRHYYDIYANEEVDVFLDASGFQYSDQWGEKSVKELEARIRKAHASGKKYIFLPQAFGPFENSQVADPLRRCLDLATRIYARDAVSETWLRRLLPNADTIYRAPDFTSLVSPLTPEYLIEPPYAVLVPNARMLDKTRDSSGVMHIEFLSCAAHELCARGYKVVAMTHSPGDRELIARLAETSRVPMHQVNESHPRVLKGYIAAASMVIGSRFHALQSALSSGVPAFVAGWSHKYQEMLRDYGVEAWCLAPDSDIFKQMELFIDAAEQDHARMELYKRAELLKQKSIQMWHEIEALL